MLRCVWGRKEKNGCLCGVFAVTFAAVYACAKRLAIEFKVALVIVAVVVTAKVVDAVVVVAVIVVGAVVVVAAINYCSCGCSCCHSPSRCSCLLSGMEGLMELPPKVDVTYLVAPAIAPTVSSPTLEVLGATQEDVVAVGTNLNWATIGDNGVWYRGQFGSLVRVNQSSDSLWFFAFPGPRSTPTPARLKRLS